MQLRVENLFFVSPPCSRVWKDEERKEFGRTCGDRGVYKDHKLLTLEVSNVNNKIKYRVWEWNSVVKMSLLE